MKRIFITTLFAIGVFFTVEAFAMELSQARAKGIVGERLDGYIGAIESSSDASAVVNEINARRSKEYERISKENKQPVSVVGRVAAENIINGLPVGSFYQGADGSWRKK